jgi:hypothetical protein
METVFQTSVDELSAEKNKIKELEEKVRWLETELHDKEKTILAIEQNMERLYVENWTIKDRGTFSGNVYWIKGGGILFYDDGTRFEGDWDSTGKITDGELYFTHSGELVTRWENGKEIAYEDELEEKDYSVDEALSEDINALEQKQNE